MYISEVLTSLAERFRPLNVFPRLRDVTLNKTDCRNMAADELMGLRDEIINVIRTREQVGHCGAPLRSVNFGEYASAPLNWLQSLKAIFPEIISWSKHL